MECKIYKIDNTNFLTLDGSCTTIKVLKGHAYLFVAPVLEDGRLGARHEITDYAVGGVFPNIPSNDKFKVILTGTIGTEVEVVPFPDPDFDAVLAEARELVIEKMELDEEKYRERSVRQQQLSDEAYSNALENISSVVNRSKRQNLLFEPEDSAVVRVFKIVAEKMGGMKVHAHPGREYEPTKTGIQKFAKDNTVRVREVVLRGKWFKEDNGHLIAFYNPNGEIDLEKNATYEDSSLIPVALIKNVERTGYIMVNPMDGSQIRVTKKNVNQIHPMAFMMYKALNEEKITLKSVCKFVFKDIKADIFRYVAIALLCTLIGLITPLITRNFIDHVIPEAAKSQAVQICVLAPWQSILRTCEWKPRQILIWKRPSWTGS